MRRLRLLHAIHDFLPRHRAGSEIYAFELCRELARRHDVFVVCAEYDPRASHGTIRWRAHGGLPVIEIVNNWQVETFEDPYRSKRITDQLVHVLEATRPDVLHVHNLLNLSFDLPRRARERGIATAATLHDYTLVCASGGQRVHARESHLCHDIDTMRCSRCFAASPFHAQMVGARLSRSPVLRPLGRAALAARSIFPVLTDALARRIPSQPATPGQMHDRLSRGKQVLGEVDLFVAPSAALAAEYGRLGLDEARIEVSDYGFDIGKPVLREARSGPLRIGFVGSMVWHKGAHVLIDAIRRMRGAFEVVIAGDPNVGPAYHAGLRAAAAGLPVYFSGPFDRADVPRIYGSLDVLVVPSLWLENSPLVIHEAFVHGAAVVASRLGGIPDLVTDGVNGFTYEAFSAQALADVLQRLVDEPDLAARLASRAPAVKTIDDDARGWEARYEGLLEARPRAPA